MLRGVQSHKSSLELCHRDLVLLFWKVHLHGRQPQQDRSQHNPTFDKWLESHFNLQRRFHHSVLSRQQSPPTTNLTAAFSFFFSTKKTATVGQIVRSGPYQCCSVHVNLQEGGSGNSKTRKKAETFHNSRSH